MNAAQLAGIFCNDEIFRIWVTTFTTLSATVTKEQAAQFIREVCQVESRAELATNKEAAQRFDKIIRKLFVAWRDEYLR
jgi:hypothetical protein